MPRSNSSDNKASPPTPPHAEYVFTISADITVPKSAGAGVNGERKHIAIVGGTLSGPGIQGQILPGGSDWLWQRPDGCAEVQAHYTVEIDDGTLVYVKNYGLRVAPKHTRLAMQAGEAVDPQAYYFRSSPVFDVPDGPHQWLREHIFVATLAPRASGVLIEVFCIR